RAICRALAASTARTAGQRLSPRVARCQGAATWAVPPLRGPATVYPFTSGAVRGAVRPPPRRAPQIQVRRGQALRGGAARARGAGRSAPTAAQRTPAPQQSRG